MRSLAVLGRCGCAGMLSVRQPRDGGLRRFQRLAGAGRCRAGHAGRGRQVRLAGNDVMRHQAFIARVQQYQSRLRAYFQEAIQRAALGDEQHACVRTCLGGYGFRDFDKVPRFAE